MDATHATAPQLAGIYCRLSYAPDGSLEKVERQEADCRQLAARLDWPISDRHVYVDNSRSAWQRNRRRPQWDRMLADLQAGKIGSIVTYHGDRLMRQPYDLEQLLAIADRGGVRLASVSGTRDLDSPDDRFILRVEVAAACRESDSTSRRIRRNHDAAVREHGRTQNGGYRPFGFGVQIGTRTEMDRATGVEVEVPVWDRDRHNPTEAPYVVEAAERLLAGQSQAGVIAWLRAEGVTSTRGGPFTARGLRHIMLRPRTAGLIEYQGELYPAAWDGLLPRETWEAVGALYRQSAEEHPYAGRERRYLLAGIATCYACGGTVRTKPTGGRNRPDSRIYHCWHKGCLAVGRSQVHLDAYVEGRTYELLQDPRFLRQLVRAAARPEVAQEITELERRRDDTQAQLDQLADHPDVDVTAALVGLASFKRRLAELRAELAATSSQRLLARMAGVTREQWEAEPVDVRSATVDALWEITILPTSHRGPGFDPASVRMIRKPAAGSAPGEGGR